MRIRRLGWAGVEVVAGDSTLVIDYVRDFPLLTAGHPHGAFVEPGNRALAALVSHLHADHTDVEAIENAVGATGLVLRPAPSGGANGGTEFTEPVELALARSALDVRVTAEWERHELGPFIVTAVPAVDGLGDPQVNWVVEADGRRMFHGGDTMWHGYWWLIAQRLGPITVAALPINGAVVDVPHLQPASPFPAVLTPEQAVLAAQILGASALLPIHFGVHQPPGYVEAPQAFPAAVLTARNAGIHVPELALGSSIDLDVDEAR